MSMKWEIKAPAITNYQRGVFAGDCLVCLVSDPMTAQLVSAAPEMLEVMQMIVDGWRKSHRTSASAIERAAMDIIAKVQT
jgi:hypothetical protein